MNTIDENNKLLVSDKQKQSNFFSLVRTGNIVEVTWDEGQRQKRIEGIVTKCHKNLNNSTFTVQQYTLKKSRIASNEVVSITFMLFSPIIKIKVIKFYRDLRIRRANISYIEKTNKKIKKVTHY